LTSKKGLLKSSKLFLLSNENIYTWYTFATEIFKEVELNKNNFEDFNKPLLP
jgi:dTDP-4-dehydrorhamnose reductase